MTKEEAIRRIKAKKLDPDDMEVLSAVIPELAESEDERIRKALVNEISGWSDVYKMFKYAPKEKVLAWLEKQKVNKVNTEGDFGRGYDCGYQAGHSVAMNEMKPKVATATLDSENQKEQEHTCDSAQFEEGFKTGLELGLRKKKEQQPAEYLDLDNASQDYVYNHFCQGADFTPDYIKGLMEDAFIDGANWQKEQKPIKSEWSDEDEKIVRFYEADYNNQIGDMSMKDVIDMRLKFKDWLVNRLKDLRPQPKSNMSTSFMLYLDEIRPDGKMCLSNGECADIEQAFQDMDWGRIIRYAEKYQPKQEWSKEDERILKGIIGLIDHDQHYGVSNNEMISWLKSLRPSRDCSSCAKHLEGYISGRCDAENKLLEQFGALVTAEGELHIKPRWKPSEEQMEALKWLVEYVSPSEKYIVIVKNLYEQLKKFT